MARVMQLTRIRDEALAAKQKLEVINQAMTINDTTGRNRQLTHNSTTGGYHVASPPSMPYVNYGDQSYTPIIIKKKVKTQRPPIIQAPPI